MAVDYAKKKAPKRKPAPKKRKGAASKPRAGARGGARKNGERSPLPRVLTAIVILVAFVSLLVWLKLNRAEEPIPVGGSSAPQLHEEPLPEPPQEQWQYIDELENKEVQVDIPERAESHPRVIQCGSFRSQEDAEAMRAQIAFIGLEAQIKATEGTSGLWYRVVLGPFENQRAAQSTNHQLQRGGMHGCQIWNWTFD